LPHHRGGLCLTHNEYRGENRSIEQWIADREIGGDGLQFISAAERAHCIAAGSIWELTWYPQESGGFQRVVGASLANVLTWARLIDISQER
jgi:hypothetical protein